MVKFIIESGFIVDFPALMHHAICRRNHDLVIYFLENKFVGVGSTELYAGVLSRDLNIVSTLIKHGCDPTTNNQKALRIAVSGADTSMIKLLLNYGYYFIQDENLDTSIMYCITQKTGMDCIKLLIENGIRIRNKHIKIICNNKNMTMLEYVLSQELDIGSVSDTILETAQKCNNSRVIQLLRDR